MSKKSKGRQKIEMVKMKNESNLQVTFSKRRSGLFKKASELCTLCGAEVALIVFSPGRKVFSFGHPNVETVIDRFLNNNLPVPNQNNNVQLNEPHRNSVIREMNNQLTQKLDELESEKKKNEKLTKLRENSKTSENWWENAIEGFSLSQCTKFKAMLENLKNSVRLEASKLFQANMSHQNFYTESSNNAAFRVDGGSYINPDLNLFNQRRMVNTNAFINNQNMILPNHAVQFRNHGNTNITERFFSGYNMNYTVGFNQDQVQNQFQLQNQVPNPNQMQNQIQNEIVSVKKENKSENDEHHHHGYPPHPRRDYH